MLGLGSVTYSRGHGVGLTHEHLSLGQWAWRNGAENLLALLQHYPESNFAYFYFLVAGEAQRLKQ